jgi:hypothetical protein
MSFETPDEPVASSKSRRPLMLLAVVVLLVAAFLGGRVLLPLVRGVEPEPAPAAATKPEVRPAPPVDAPPPPAASEPVREVTPRPRAKREAPKPVEPAAPARATTGELRIDSDVPGAMVFLDRVYLGAAPVNASNVAPGPHQLNVSAEGHEGYSETINVEPGPATITVRFNEIRLKEALDVVHKHTMGSCEGRLVADPEGVRYETSNKGDRFSLRFAEIETFEVDYLKKNLRIKRRGGKTWNFTSKAENADPLFVFHRNVDKVRLQILKVGGAGDGTSTPEP